MRHLFEYMEFDELSSKAKTSALDNVRNEKYSGRYGGDDVASWVIDDDSLFEPPHEEMEKLFGDDYYEDNGNRFMIQNLRKDIYFIGKQDPNYYLHCENAIDISNDNLFLRWLEIPAAFRPHIYYMFKSSGKSNTTIVFEIEDLDSMIAEYGEESEDLLTNYCNRAERKFSDHMDRVLTRISNDIDAQFEDGGIIDTIEINDIKFEEDGSIAGD